MLYLLYSKPVIMMQPRAIYVLLLLIALWPGKSFAQFHISNEVGVLAGPAAFFTDYGERFNLRNNLDNEGFGVGLVHYMDFAYRAECTCKRREWFFSKHFRIRNEIDYFHTKLEHYGPTAQGNDESGRILRAMHGKTSLWQIGTSLEYHFYGIKEFRDFGVLWSPYISLGVQFINYNPSAYSDLGPIDSPKVLFRTFQGGLDLERGNSFAIIGSGGFRYHFTRRSDFNVEGRWMYYETDFIEGLSPVGPQNKFNDFAFWISVGYIYVLNF